MLGGPDPFNESVAELETLLKRARNAVDALATLSLSSEPSSSSANQQGQQGQQKKRSLQHEASDALESAVEEADLLRTVVDTMKNRAGCNSVGSSPASLSSPSLTATSKKLAEREDLIEKMESEISALQQKFSGVLEILDAAADTPSSSPSGGGRENDHQMATSGGAQAPPPHHGGGAGQNGTDNGHHNGGDGDGMSHDLQSYIEMSRQKEQEQAEILDELHYGLESLGQKGKLISGELGEQEVMLEEVNVEIDTVRGKLTRQAKSVNDLLEKMNARGRVYTIGGLILVLFFLFILVIYI